MGGMSAETATGASRGSYPLLPMDELEVPDEMGDHLPGLASGTMSKQAIPQSPPLFSPAGGGGCKRAMDLCLATQPMSMSARCWDAYKACVNYPDLWQIFPGGIVVRPPFR